MDLQYNHHYKYIRQHDSKHDIWLLLRKIPDKDPYIFDLYKPVHLDIQNLLNILAYNLAETLHNQEDKNTLDGQRLIGNLSSDHKAMACKTVVFQFVEAFLSSQLKSSNKIHQIK